MSSENNNNIRGDRRGQMPFAMIAVTLLLLTAFYGIICYSIENNEENTENITDELMSVSDGIKDTEKYIEVGLGKIINDVSTDNNGGNLVKRTETFDSRMDSWFSDTFPLKDKGASVELLDYDIGLELKNMKLSSGNGVEDENRASYLEATGTANVKYVTGSTETEKTLYINADGLSGLPFVVNSSTKFELSSAGSDSILIELVSYQLTALAQYRILNGYGSTSESGEYGTDSIITEKDVGSAFRNALSILESLCFRSNGEGRSQYVISDHIDVADLLLIDDEGYLTIDISAIFSQTISSLMDMLVTRWIELVGGDVVLDLLDKVSDVVRKCVDCIVSFFTGNSIDRSSVEYYFEQLMDRYDIDEGSFRYLNSQRYTIGYNGGTYDVTYDGRTETVNIPSMDIDIESDSVDIYEWGGWDGFVDDYHEGRNDIREMIKTYIHSITNGITSGLGSVKVEASAYDSIELSEKLSSAVDRALNDRWGATMTLIDDTITNSEVTDPLYAAIYEKMNEQRDSIYHESSFRQQIENKIEERIDAYITSNYGSMADDRVLEQVMNDIHSTGQIDSVCNSYSASVSNKMDMFANVLNNVPKDTDSFIKELLINAGRQTFDGLGVFDLIKDNAHAMCKEMTICIDCNSQSGLIELEKEDSYLLYDPDGNSHREYITIGDDYDLRVNLTSPRNNASKNCHNVGLDEISMATYTATYSIGIKTTIHYDASSTTSTMKSLGTSDAEYSNDIVIDTVMDIPCVSGWGLAGVDYQPSTNILNEMWELLLKFLEPIIEPLTELYKTLESLFNICATAVVEISTFVSELVQQIYDLLMKPIEMLTEFINGCINSIASDIVSAFDIGLNKQTFVMTVFGFTLKIETKLTTMFDATKSLAKITMEKMIGDAKAFAFMELKEKSKEYMIQCGGGFENDDCNIDVEIDPLMKFGKEMVSANGYIRGVSFDISLPNTVTYDKAEMKLSDVPGISEAISNIPLPIPDVKGSFDMGFEIKYNLPDSSGLVINEFESNPLGDDSGGEWAELYNGNLSAIDVTGYVLAPGSDSDRSVTLSGTIEPMGHMVVNFDDEILCNSKTKNSNGEKLILYDSGGNKVNETGWKKDTSNNDFTWQRKSDGAGTWVFKNDTKGKANGNILDANVFEQNFFIDQFSKAVSSAMDRLEGRISSYDDVSNLLKYTVQYFISNVIDTIGDCLVSATAYLKLQLDDYTSSLHGGIKVALSADSDLVEEGLRWILSQIDFLADYVKSPSCSDPVELVCENVYLTTSVYGQIGTPAFLKDVGNRVTVALVSSVNISGLCSLAGVDEGKWRANVGILLEDIPGKLLPSPLKKNTDKHCDLWLIKGEFTEK